MFVKRKAKHWTGIYIAGIFKTMLPKNDPSTIYQVPDADGTVAVQAGVYEEVMPEKGSEFFRLDHPPRDCHEWAWVPETI